MLRQMLKSKLHRLTVTAASVDYEGSITLDEELMRAADLLEYEKVLVADLNNGERFETYVIKGEPGSGTVCVNGAAARLVDIGDLVIVMSFASFTTQELDDYQPKLIYVDVKNRIQTVKILS